MSKFLSAVAKQEFDDEVKHAFQNMTGLRDSVTVRNNVVGDIYKFRRMGKGMAKQKPTQALVIPMDVEHTLIDCPLGNWHASEYTDIFDAAEVNFDEQRELAMTISWALGRRLDQNVIDALDAESSYAGQVPNSVGGANSNLNVAKLRRAKALLDDEGVPSTGRHILHSPFGLEAMLGETAATSADFNTVRALVNGEIDTFVGFRFHSVEARDEGGLQIDGSDDRTSYAYHESAVGLAIGIDLPTEVAYINERTSWLATGLLKSGAVSRDGKGIVEIITRES